jgi:hypothetical protein
MRQDECLVISVEECAQRLSISRALAYELCRSNPPGIPAIRLGKRRLVVSVAALEQMLSGGWQPQKK